MSANATVDIKNSATKTPLDYMAEGYWQDFLAGQAIAGGIAYHESLQACQLDESLLSLQRVDILLSQIRRDILKSAALNEAVVVADERYRNLLVFLAFYAGRVLALQWYYLPKWYGQFELAKRYPDLPVADDFYQHMAVAYRDSNPKTETAVINQDAAVLFFALEPIGQRLFGNIDRQFTAVQGGQVENGLYQAVVKRLPNVAVKQRITANKSIDSADKGNQSIATQSIATQSVVDNSITKPSLIKEAVSSKTNAVTSTVIKPASSESISPENTLLTPVIKNNKPPAPTPEIFTQLLQELASIEVVQISGNDDYNQACKILDQFERHIARQNIARSEVAFSQTHQEQRHHALAKLQDSAAVGHTGAMLRLAMYELLGEGLIADNNADNNADKKASNEAGVERVKQAANAQDSRAQRLLSRLYYQGVGQGFGVEQDMQSGRHWLEQAAKNGHSEAATLLAQWQQAQTLITTREQEQHSTKRYQLLIIVVIIASIALIVFV